MATFEKAHARTSRNEGGYQCAPEDNGNWTGGVRRSGKLIGTKYGISAPVLKAYLKREPTVEDMKTLSKETSVKIYRRLWWDVMRGDEIEDEEMAFQLYDMGVNAGMGAGIKLFQEQKGIPQTGKVDTLTLNVLNNKV